MKKRKIKDRRRIDRRQKSIAVSRERRWAIRRDSDIDTDIRRMLRKIKKSRSPKPRKKSSRRKK